MCLSWGGSNSADLRKHHPASLMALKLAIFNREEGCKGHGGRGGWGGGERVLSSGVLLLTEAARLTRVA